MGHMLKKSNKIGKIDYVRQKIEYTSLLKKNFFFFFEIILIEINQKTCKIFLIQKTNLGICHKSFFLIINVGKKINN